MTASASVQRFPSRDRQDVIDTLDSHLAATRGPAGLALVDVDRFDTVVDLVSDLDGGREYLIAAIGERLGGELLEGDDTAWLGADHFVIVRCPLTGPAEIEGLGRRLIELFASPLDVVGRRVEATISVGVATSRQGDKARSLVRYAEYALDDAKTLGRNQLVAFADEERGLLAENGDQAGR